jgi:hypothetical protein
MLMELLKRLCFHNFGGYWDKGQGLKRAHNRLMQEQPVACDPELARQLEEMKAVKE